MTIRFQYIDIFEFTDFLNQLKKHYYVTLITAPIKNHNRNEVTIHFETR